MFTVDAVYILKYFQFVNFSIKRLLDKLFNKEWEIVVEIYCVIIFIVNVMICLRRLKPDLVDITVAGMITFSSLVKTVSTVTD